jgi:hypothetical protein
LLHFTLTRTGYFRKLSDSAGLPHKILHVDIIASDFFFLNNYYFSPVKLPYRLPTIPGQFMGYREFQHVFTYTGDFFEIKKKRKREASDDVLGGLSNDGHINRSFQFLL